MTITSISLTENLFERMNKYITNKSKPIKQLTIHLPEYHTECYNSIDKGDRSCVFSCIISDFLDILKKEGIEIPICFSNNEFIRMAIMYSATNKKILERLSTKTPNGKGIVGKIPIGNQYHPNGEWKNRYRKYDILRYSFLEKIYKKLNKSFSRNEISCNFEVFHNAYRDGLFNDTKIEYQIKKLKEMLKK